MKKLLFVLPLLVILLGAQSLVVDASTGTITYTVNPHYVQVTTNTVAPQGIPFCQGGALMCYTPSYIRAAYNIPASFDGAGQTIVIVDAFGSPTIAQDLKTFDATFGLPDPPSFQVICPAECPAFNVPNSGNSKLPHDQIGWSIETSLDVEWAHAIAPKANIVLAVAPAPGGDSINLVESYVISHYPGSIISQSFGSPEFLLHNNNAQLNQAHANYLAAMAQNITVLASAGDDGGSNGFTALNALFPGSDPYVTSVGGTQGNPYYYSNFPGCTTNNCLVGLVRIDNSTGLCPMGRPTLNFTCPVVGYGGEEVWNEPAPGFGVATGGALSLLFATPSYQSSLQYQARATPDVSYNAAISGGVLVVWTAVPSQAGIYVVGGTSAGSPQWAGIFALVNQYAAANGKGPIGFANPLIYQLAQGATYSSDFHDITVGNDMLFGTLPGNSAGTGYDLASGWGTPNVGNLVPDLFALMH